MQAINLRKLKKKFKENRKSLRRFITRTENNPPKNLQILAEQTGQPLEKIERDTERDYYMSADEAKDYGVVDQVISKRP